VKHVEQSNNIYTQQLSREIERTNRQFNIPGKQEVYSFLYSKMPTGKVVHSKFPKAIINNFPVKIKVFAEKHQVKDKYSCIVKNLSTSSVKVDKDNIFWKIGEVIFKVGVIILGIGGGVFVSSGGGGIQLFGLLGLGVILLSLPFFLLAIIITSMKKRSSFDKERSNDEEI
jgi:hypothetical protein